MSELTQLTPSECAARSWDAVIVGSGAGGSAIAWRLSSKGWRVLILERGPRLTGTDAGRDEHLAQKTGRFRPLPREAPNVVVGPGGQKARETCDAWSAVCVGGGTVVGAGYLQRFPRDVLSEWPIPPETMEPYYAEVERFMGIAGSGDLPPLQEHRSAVQLIEQALNQHNLPSQVAPRAILTRARGDRGQCVYCKQCEGFRCRTGAKGAVDVTFLSAAKKTGRCVVLPGQRVMSLLAGGSGRIRGVRTSNHLFRGSTIILAAGAIQDARLLKTSGIGGPLVGRNLLVGRYVSIQGHFPYPSKTFPPDQEDQPFVNRLTTTVDGSIYFERPGGSLLSQATQITKDLPGAKILVGDALRERLVTSLRDERAIELVGYVRALSATEQRVSVDPKVVDKQGVRVARITLARPKKTEIAAEGLQLTMRALLRTMGAVGLKADTPLTERLSFHAGTCRMGSEPAGSVTGTDGYVHKMSNLVVADSATLPSMGSTPPMLTIMANAVRIGDQVLGRRT